ncbi:amidase domain-containing protein [Bacillus sp. FSL K6-3431]|uniref:amidase domain-containing protein n=1 Tax=Bacillus sp. FSL K6-3431 TaxID=2921500 RepID=UPI0030F68BC0
MKKQLVANLEKRVDGLVRKEKVKEEKIVRKLESINNRNAKIVKVIAKGKISKQEEMNEHDQVYYDVHLKYLIKTCEGMYIEEEIEQRKASFYKGELLEDVELPVFIANNHEEDLLMLEEDFEVEERANFVYNRLDAVRYAEKWWNTYNPAYEKFDVDCTNYISQCLHAGGAPMRAYPNRSKGWWYQNKNWSYSWSVANALKVYLQGSKTGLKAKEVTDPLQLKLGDVICYDFQGDGRFDHNTIVTAKDAAGMPLVNAHTYNSRMRYWAYEDSSAYTPNMKYKMFTIIDG